MLLNPTFVELCYVPALTNLVLEKSFNFSRWIGCIARKHHFTLLPLVVFDTHVPCYLLISLFSGYTDLILQIQEVGNRIHKTE